MSPILANLFLHYAFAVWIRREMPTISFCRYADDGLLHCQSQRQAEYVLKRIAQRFKECGLKYTLASLELFIVKIKIVEKIMNESVLIFLDLHFSQGVV